MPNTRLYHTLFGIALVTMVALGTWWFILHSRRVEEIHQARVKTLTLQAHLFSIQMGGYPKNEPPPLFADDSPFEVAPSDQLGEGEIGFPMRPNWPHLVVRARLAALKALEEVHYRQRIMVTGEGTLLVLLILVCIFMLYRLLLTERQTRRTMETFFHAVSHELKTPVAGIKALLETLAARHFNEEEQIRYANLGLRETARLVGLLQNILLSRRFDDGRPYNLKLREINLVAELHKRVKRRNRVFAGQQVELLVECDKEAAVLADPDLLRHIVGNLVDNGFKYSPNDPRVTVRLRTDERWGMIDVEDNGIGWAPGERDRLFKKFWRSPEAVQYDSHGSGLGLFIAAELAKSFGGRLEAYSEGTGKGSHFTLYLRRAQTRPDDSSTR